MKTAVVGVAGYSGAELARLLTAHPRLQGTVPVFMGREGAQEVPLWTMHPQLAVHGAASPKVIGFDAALLQAQEIDVVFLATPHEFSREWAPKLVANGHRVIDLSGAWRLDEPAHVAVYKFEDADPAAAAATQASAVYGAPELHADAIRSAKLLANPGCYATSVILALAPLALAKKIDLSRGIVADAKSGVSGAGKTPSAETHFMYAADNLSAYKVFGHRHTGELLEQLGLSAEDIRFTPHLLPIPRGILASVYVRLKDATTAAEVAAQYKNFYAVSPMVRVHAAGSLPQIQHVVRTSYCDIGVALSPNGRDLLIVSCLDNLLKGAAGQAVQNMNLMFGFGETESLL